MIKNNFLTLLIVLFTDSSFGQNLDNVPQTVKYRGIGPFIGGRTVSVWGVHNDLLAIKLRNLTKPKLY